MARFDAFTAGASFTLASAAAASEKTVNYFPEPIAGVANAEKGPMALVRTPGISRFTSLPKGPNRGLWPGEQRLFAAGGDHLYEVHANGSTTDHGNIGNDGNPVQMFPNGAQLFVVSNGFAWIDTGTGAAKIQFSIDLTDLAIDGGTGGLTGATGGIFDATDVGCTVKVLSGTGFTVQTQAITSVVAGQAFGAGSWGTGGSTGGQATEFISPGGVVSYVLASQGAFLDGYFFASTPNGKTVFYSAINDGTKWNPLDFFTKASYPDNVSAMLADHQELYVFGDLESTQVYQDTGDALNPFKPDPGAIMHYACIAPYSLARLDEGVAWIGGDDRRGDRLAFLAIGFRPRKISTAAEEIAWAAYATVADAVAYTELYNGHQFWVIHFPTGNATWAYDLTTGMWSQRGWWHGTLDANGFPVWDRQRQAFHAVVALVIGNQEQHFVGDWQNGNIYIQSENYLDDDGTAIYRMRMAPHLTTENRRTSYNRWEIDCDVTGLQRVYWNRLGTGRDRIWAMVTWQTATTGVSMQLWWSDTRGQSWQTAMTGGSGNAPQVQTLAVGVDVTLASAYLLATPGNA